MDIIKSASDISYLFAHAKRYNTRSISLLIHRNEDQHDPRGRVAFIAGKKNGNAVWRNSAKRRMRAIAQDLQAPWAGYDVVFIAKRDILNDKYSKVLSNCRILIRENVEIQTQ